MIKNKSKTHISIIYLTAKLKCISYAQQGKVRGVL